MFGNENNAKFSVSHLLLEVYIHILKIRNKEIKGEELNPNLDLCLRILGDVSQIMGLSWEVNMTKTPSKLEKFCEENPGDRECRIYDV